MLHNVYATVDKIWTDIARCAVRLRWQSFLFIEIQIYKYSNIQILKIQIFKNSWDPIYKISYDLSHDYVNFIVRSTYDSDLQRAKISLGNRPIVNQFSNTVSHDLMISQLNRI